MSSGGQCASDDMIEAGKIKFFEPTLMLTPEQRTKVAAASAPAKKP